MTCLNIKHWSRNLTIADQTQRLIGQNLHDDISQEMTGLSLKTEALQEIVSLQDKTSQALIADIISTLERTQAKISVLSKGLIPVAVEFRRTLRGTAGTES